MTIKEVLGVMNFVGGQYLHSKALPVSPGVQVTVKEIRTEAIENPVTREKKDSKVLYTEEMPQWGIVLGAKCNRLALLDMLKAGENSTALIGRKVNIYKDPKVRKPGQKRDEKPAGAIRIK